jgi:hypothetical protein
LLLLSAVGAFDRFTRTAKGLAEQFTVKGFSDVVDDAELFALLDCLDVVRTGDHDDSGALPPLMNPFRQPKPIVSRHLEFQATQ